MYKIFSFTNQSFVATILKLLDTSAASPDRDTPDGRPSLADKQEDATANLKAISGSNKEQFERGTQRARTPSLLGSRIFPKGFLESRQKVVLALHGMVKGRCLPLAADSANAKFRAVPPLKNNGVVDMKELEDGGSELSLYALNPNLLRMVQFFVLNFEMQLFKL